MKKLIKLQESGLSKIVKKLIESNPDKKPYDPKSGLTAQQWHQLNYALNDALAYLGNLTRDGKHRLNALKLQSSIDKFMAELGM